MPLASVRWIPITTVPAAAVPHPNPTLTGNVAWDRAWTRAEPTCAVGTGAGSVIVGSWILFTSVNWLVMLVTSTLTSPATTTTPTFALKGVTVGQNENVVC